MKLREQLQASTRETRDKRVFRISYPMGLFSYPTG